MRLVGTAARQGTMSGPQKLAACAAHRLFRCAASRPLRLACDADSPGVHSCAISLGKKARHSREVRASWCKGLRKPFGSQCAIITL
jgi:hypothetical protein